MNEHQMKERFEELAPWHANGTLSSEESRWVEEYARDHAEAKAELGWYDAFRRELTAATPDVAPDLGWDKLTARIRAEPKRVPKSWSERISEYVGGLLGVREGGFALRPAMAYGALAIVVVQAGVIGALLTREIPPEQQAAQWRALPSTVSGPVLQVSFKPDTTERELRQLLVRINGSVIGGPGQLGTYIIYVPADRVAAAQSALTQDTHVEAVDVLPTLPGKE